MLSAKEAVNLQKTIEKFSVKGGRKKKDYMFMRQIVRKIYDDDFINELPEQDQQILEELHKRYVQRKGKHHTPPKQSMAQDRRDLERISKYLNIYV